MFAGPAGQAEELPKNFNFAEEEPRIYQQLEADSCLLYLLTCCDPSFCSASQTCTWSSGSKFLA